MRDINWHPAWANPLDFVTWEEEDRALVTPQGKPVNIIRDGNDFVVTIGDDREITGSNLATCYFLNLYQVGELEKKDNIITCYECEITAIDSGLLSQRTGVGFKFQGDHFMVAQSTRIMKNETIQNQKGR